MGIFHFLNVKQGDCNIIEHASGHVTVIDVCNARLEDQNKTILGRAFDNELMKANYGQKNQPVNPIEYMRARGMNSVFRFIATHPDMDHIDGIKDFFAAFSVWNFWYTKNDKKITDWGNNCPWRKEDWDFYTSLRDGTVANGPTRLALHADARGKYYNQDDNNGGGDGLHILAPTPTLAAAANDAEDHNDSSYAILYCSAGGRILFLGDAHDGTMEHILKHHTKDVTDLDLLIAPHHGRHSDRDFDFLNVMRPKLTLFGNAPSEHLAYGPWHSRDLPIITNNQAGSVIVDTNSPGSMAVYVTNETFAKARNPLLTFYSQKHGGWYLRHISSGVAQAAE